jgi:hypothetical protein
MGIYMGCTPDIMQEASYEIVWYDLAILMFMSLCILLYFVRFLFFLIASTCMGAPYVRIGTTAPL